MSTTTHLITADELMRLPRNGNRYELLKGELLTMTPTGYEHSEIAANLITLLNNHVRKHDLGRIAGTDGGFILESDPDTVLAPDISFIKAGRLINRPRNYARIVPDLVVEIISPGDRKRKVIEKAKQWLSFGVRSVWLVKPQDRTVEVFSPDGTTRILDETEILFDDVVPGLEIPVRVIFE
ncbi:MAG TPA: Uma2 family endonuclease [Pyrinomonadaceae bacterium]